MRGKPILCIDFDGVIHSYTSGWKGTDVVADPPVPGALRWIWKATEWFDIRVYSSRSREAAGRAAMDIWWRTECTKEFGEPSHPAENCVEFCHEKPAAFLTIDDRAICFEGTWSDLDPTAMLDFKPWNKREAAPTIPPYQS